MEATGASTSVFTTTIVQTEVLASQSQERQPSQDTEVSSQSTPDTSICTTIIVQTEVPVGFKQLGHRYRYLYNLRDTIIS